MEKLQSRYTRHKVEGWGYCVQQRITYAHKADVVTRVEKKQSNIADPTAEGAIIGVRSANALRPRIGIMNVQLQGYDWVRYTPDLQLQIPTTDHSSSARRLTVEWLQIVRPRANPATFGSAIEAVEGPNTEVPHIVHITK